MTTMYHLYTNDSRPRLAAPAHEPFICGEPFERDGAARVQASRRDADLCPQAEFAAVGELGRGVVHDDRAVDIGQESFGHRRILGDDRVGVAARMRVDMRERAGNSAAHGDRDDRATLSAAPVTSAGRGDL